VTPEVDRRAEFTDPEANALHPEALGARVVARCYPGACGFTRTSAGLEPPR
jgi:hypothetical protein